MTRHVRSMPLLAFVVVAVGAADTFAHDTLLRDHGAWPESGRLGHAPVFKG